MTIIILLEITCAISDCFSNKFKVYLIYTLGLWGVLNLYNEINRDVNRIKGLFGLENKTEIFKAKMQL